MGRKIFRPCGVGGYFYVPRGMVGHGLKLAAPTWVRPYEGWGIYFYVPSGTVGRGFKLGVPCGDVHTGWFLGV